MKTHFTLPFLLLILSANLNVVMAQDNYEIQVYASEVVPKKHTIFELHSNYTFKSSDIPAENIVSADKALHETVEITHGFTNCFEVGSYLFTSWGSGNRSGLVGVHLRPRVVAPASWKLPLGLSLGTEVGYQKAAFFGDQWMAEIRPIIDKQFGKCYFAMNLTMDVGLDKGQKHEADFNPSLKAFYDLSEKVSLGFEYYTALGAVKNFDPVKMQKQLLFGALEWDLGPEWEFNAGLGYGLTPASDKWIFKLILGYRIPD